MKTILSLLTSLIFFSQVADANSFKVQRWQTANGAKVVFYQALEVPMLDINIAFAAGSAYDGPKFGLSSLTTNLLNQGNAGDDATVIAEKLANIGAQYQGESSRDMVVLSLKTLTTQEALKQAVGAFGLILSQPDFPVEAFQREKNQQLLAIAQTQESPDDVANIIFFERLYKDHPYGHPVIGLEDTVKSLELTDVRHFYKQYFVAANAVIVMVGAIDVEKAHQLAEQLTQPLARGQAAPAIPKAPQLKAADKITVDFPSSQTILRLGQVGIDHHSPDYFPLTVGNYILGGGALVSRLANEVREKRGLTYGVVSQFMPMPGYGPFLISLSTVNQQAPTALKITEDTLKQFIADGPNEAELMAAKKYLTGSFPLSLSSNSSIASMLLRIAFYNLPDDYLTTYVERINAVSTAEIKAAFQKQINSTKMLLVSVGKL
ncbi:M16 family metallopeptidase [Legionella jordanis]|uniref:Zinc protease (Peptidase, M16 family) n=1 Tax=Legionella jordanis TaxID=456 RepID=A0A0W0VBM1_9GAMM|nr:pitrilysin family protein [Legionella jordanis]KTD17511.1 zinc protease (peptidase, M16 family) [Legionella jordanis]RMX05151.1 insulinase family protein [Legionella jordanis]RMX17407.1 insulinase family protein [Legionella jordanis]VEH13480.1 zinc protease (peptidase, M16 family) [Legionella jordanis]HAT8714397.1 insulinase family protein [Legionella jordanis]